MPTKEQNQIRALKLNGAITIKVSPYMDERYVSQMETLDKLEAQGLVVAEVIGDREAPSFQVRYSLPDAQVGRVVRFVSKDTAPINTAALTPVTSEQQQRYELMVSQARAVVIHDDVELGIVAARLQELTAMEDEMHATFDPIVATSEAALKKAREIRDGHLKPVAEAKRFLKTAATAFSARRQRERDEAIKRAREAQEIQAMATALAEDQLATAESLASAGRTEESEKALADAVRLEAESKEILAPAIPQVAKAPGLQWRELTRWKVIDANLIPREYLTVDSKAVDQTVKKNGLTAKIPGIEVYSERIAVTQRG